MTPALPTEIVQLVFRELHPDASESVATTLSVSAISQHWRAVALSTPFLWSTLSFSLRTHNEAMLSAFYKRSLPEPLHITISFDFLDASQFDAAAIKRALTLFIREADRIEHLHLRFLAPLHGQGHLLGPFVCFPSSGLKHLEMESLTDEEGHENLIVDLSAVPNTESWSDCCPALTHVTCTAPALLPDIPANITHMRIKGVHGRRNVIDYYEIENILSEPHVLTELVIDGASLKAVFGAPALLVPHLRALSLRSSPLSDDGGSADGREMAEALGTLDMPALVSLTIPELNEELPAWLDDAGIRIPSVTRFAVVPGSSRLFSAYAETLPGVEELVLLGSGDPELRGLADLDDAWPRLRTIDLAQLDPPPRQSIRAFSDNLCQYGRARFQSGYRLRVLVRLPRGILPEDLPVDITQFMEVCAA